MPRPANIVQVFVASPSDLGPEREALESLIVELNRSWSASLGIMFELLRWETHTHPAFGSDPQAIVNEQIGDSYDVFIGILWGRFGSPTPRALSGTLEEFDRALERLTTQAPPPDVMMYIKDAPISPSKLDPEQLRLITEFRKSLSARGGLYSVFEDMPGFQSSLRAHLASLAQKYGVRALHGTAVSPASDSSVPEDGDRADDLGYLDYFELFEVRIALTNTALKTIAEATARIGEQVQQRTVQFEKPGMPAVDVATGRSLSSLWPVTWMPTRKY